jgi:hypothetical protein
MRGCGDYGVEVGLKLTGDVEDAALLWQKEISQAGQGCPGYIETNMRTYKPKQNRMAKARGAQSINFGRRIAQRAAQNCHLDEGGSASFEDIE